MEDVGSCRAAHSFFAFGRLFFGVRRELSFAGDAERAARCESLAFEDFALAKPTITSPRGAAGMRVARIIGVVRISCDVMISLFGLESFEYSYELLRTVL